MRARISKRRPAPVLGELSGQPRQHISIAIGLGDTVSKRKQQRPHELIDLLNDLFEHRAVEPVFASEMILDRRNVGARDLRVLDVLRGNSYGILDHALQGNENELLLRRYGDILKEWKKLKKEYE